MLKTYMRSSPARDTGAGGVVKLVSLTDNIEPLLGGIYLSCIPCTDAIIPSGRVKIIDVTLFTSSREDYYHSLVYDVAVTMGRGTAEHNPQLKRAWEVHEYAWRLLREKRVGFLLTIADAEALYHVTGRKVDGVILYGEESFWRAVAEAIHLHYRVYTPDEVLAIARLFKGHTAALRMFFGDVAIEKRRLEEAKARGETGETLMEALERYLDVWMDRLINGVDVHFCCLTPEGAWDEVAPLMMEANRRMIQYIGVLSAHSTPDKYLDIRVEISGSKRALDALALLHPRAVIRKTRTEAYVTALF